MRVSMLITRQYKVRLRQVVAREQWVMRIASAYVAGKLRVPHCICECDERSYAGCRHGCCRGSRKVSCMWPDRRILDLFKIEHPILLGPMAGAVDHAARDRGRARRRARLAPVRDAHGGAAARADGEIPRRAPRRRSTSISSVIRRPSSTTRARRAGASGSSPITRSSASIRRRRCRRATARHSTRRSARSSRSSSPRS